jgi:hypothetical protein
LDGVRRDANSFDGVMDFVANYARALQQLNRDVVNNITEGTF